MLKRVGSFLGLAVMSLVVAGLWAVSAFFNFRFGYQSAVDGYDPMAFGMASVFLDALKSYMPFLIGGALIARRYFKVTIAAICLVGCVAFSISNAIGYRAKVGALASGKVLAKKEQVASWRAERRRQEIKLAKLEVGASADVIARKLQGKRQRSRWRSSKGCTVATARSSRTFCEGYFELESEQVKARQAAVIEKKVQELDARIATVSGVGAIRAGDAQAAMLADILGSTPEKMQTAVVLLFGLLIEFAAGFGFYMIFNQEKAQTIVARKPMKTGLRRGVAGFVAASREAPRPVAPKRGQASATGIAHRPSGVVEEFIDECLRYQEGAELPLTGFYNGYGAWCDRRAVRKLGHKDFKTKMLLIAAASEWEQVGTTRKPAWLHLAVDVGATPKLKVVG